MRLYVLILLTCWALVSCRTAEPVAVTRQPGWATKVPARSLANLYKIDDDLYRCEQPSAAAMAELKEIGVKSVLNLRRVKRDPQPEDLQLNWAHVRINTWTISYDDVLKALIEIEKAPKPVVVHCKHGSDRTGCVVAAYCLVKRQCTKAEVIEELRRGGYHFHERYFKNIIRLLNSLDVEKLRNDLRKWEEKAPVKVS